MSSQRPGPFSVTVSTSRTAAVAHVALGGDVDPVTVPTLFDVVEHLRNTGPRTVTVDLAGVTFACSTLANFLARIRQALPEHAALGVCRPTDAVRLALTSTGLASIPILEHCPDPVPAPASIGFAAGAVPPAGPDGG